MVQFAEAIPNLLMASVVILLKNQQIVNDKGFLIGMRRRVRTQKRHNAVFELIRRYFGRNIGTQFKNTERIVVPTGDVLHN